MTAWSWFVAYMVVMAGVTAFMLTQYMDEDEYERDHPVFVASVVSTFIGLTWPVWLAVIVVGRTFFPRQGAR